MDIWYYAGVVGEPRYDLPAALQVAWYVFYTGVINGNTHAAGILAGLNYANNRKYCCRQLPNNCNV